MRTSQTSSYDSASRWRRTIWSCTASRGPLLFRYYLVNTRWFAIYLHHLMTSDEDRALHDHPWSFVTCLLSSGYWEWTPAIDGTSTNGIMHRTWHRRFSVLYRPAEWQHRLELVRPMWTLVFRFRIRRNWGFITPRGWIGWKEYGRQFCD